VNGILSGEETLSLLRRAQSGDAQAEEQLILCNTALVKSIVKGYLHRGVEYDDLMQIGSMGLIKAVKGFDEAFGVRFSTYAVPMISGEIKRYLRDDGMIKVSRGLKETAIKVFRAQEELKRQLGRDPELSEISARIDIPEDVIIEATDAIREPISIYEPVYQDSGSNTLLLDTILCSDENKELTDRLLIEELLKKLDDRERKIILLRFFRDKTQSEIAAEIGVSQVQISRLITKVMDKLKELASE